MGLDLALGAMILIAAVRGWFKGFVRQAISLAALIGCVYLASPVREFARPHARKYLPSMHAEVLDRLLWWSGAVLCFVALAGVGNWLTRLRRTQPYGLTEPNRANQGAGFLLGAAKGALMACFAAAGFAQFAPEYLPEGGPVDKHTRTSHALAWNAQFHPAERIWNSSPVQAFVNQVRTHGLAGPDETAPAANEAPATVQEKHEPAARSSKDADPPVKTARRTPEMSIPDARRLDAKSPTFDADLDRELKRLGIPRHNSR